MKIICIDNFAREHIADTLVCENVNEYYGKTIVDALNNKHSGSTSPNYYVLASDSYRLHRGMEDLV